MHYLPVISQNQSAVSDHTGNGWIGGISFVGRAIWAVVGAVEPDLESGGRAPSWLRLSPKPVVLRHVPEGQWSQPFSREITRSLTVEIP